MARSSNPRSGRRQFLRNLGGAAAIGTGAALLSRSETVVYAATSGLQVYDVKTYGATGNGSTNDAPSIQTAINDAQAAKGGIVWLPPGVYKLGSGLSITQPITLAGAGWGTPSRDTTGAPSNATANGSWFFIDNTAFRPITVLLSKRLPI
ncbi:MAG: hypothetical protein IT329_07315 [Caldilineaceae bacterium]|nr:hypothetical protein [Caldilineaceae bacterium]